MRVIFVDLKDNVTEAKQTFPSLVNAIAALDTLFAQGLAYFGQVLDNDGRVLANKGLVRAQSSPHVPAES